jgi:Raf kinase inhibitor-like YbhB/YbcL family protein
MAQQLKVGELKLRSPSIEYHRRIPERFTADGEDISPALEWTGVPERTKAFAVVCHDPDAPLVDGFTHWVTYGIGGDVTGLPEGGGNAMLGVNSAGEAKYLGPAPPPDHGNHHYYFWVYALDAPLDLPAGLTRRRLHEAIEDHVIEQARLVGTYSR